jgi:hypothetical protein
LAHSKNSIGGKDEIYIDDEELEGSGRKGEVNKSLVNY